MNSTTAVITIFIATFMWASWGQFLKRIGDWPLQAFMALLYGFSVVLTFVLLIISGGFGALSTLHKFTADNRLLLIYPLIGGFLFTTGMYYYMKSISTVGLALTFMVFSAASILVGTLSSALAGGLPDDAPIPVVILGCLLVFSAVLISYFTQEKKENTQVAGTKVSKFAKIVLTAAVSGLLVSAYPFFMTLSMESPAMPIGLDTFQYMFLLSIGSLLAVIVVCIIPLAYKGELKKAFAGATGFRVIAAALSSVGHYGGNVVHGLAAPVVGMTISWPLGQTMALWGIMWGIIYGEYKGATKRAIAAIFLTIAVMAAGIALLTFSIY